MNTCEVCQSQLLHHLYGLLDGPAEAELIAHLSQCDRCQAALETARQQQRILAAAAKSEFPDVRFDAVAQPGAAKATANLPVRRRSMSWARWAAAACLFLALGVAGYPAFSWYSYRTAAQHARADFDRASQERDKLAQQQHAELQPIVDEIEKIDKNIAQIETQYRDESVRVQRIFDSKPVQFTVSHAKTLQAGGANQITIQANRKPGAAGNYRMIAMVVDDKTKSEVARTALKDGLNDFVLPANLLLKPDTRLSLRVLVTEAGKQDQTTVVDGMLPLVTSIYVTHLTTDRPMYRPGEVVYFRSLTLERFSLKPTDELFQLHFRLVRSMGGQDQEVTVSDPETGQAAQMIATGRLKDKNGAPLLGPDGKEIRGIGAGSFRLPADLPGGEYTLVVSDAAERFPAERRRFIVNRYQAPRLYKDVDFTRKSYGPGDLVTAVCKVAPVEGGRVLAQLPVTVFASVDSTPCQIDNQNQLKTDALGQCLVKFRLPANIERGEGILSVGFTDGANVETTVEPIPIIVNKLKVEFFPEGGELVAGAVNRVYFQARTPLNKPAEMHGRIVDKGDKTVASLQTFSDDKEVGVNQGMGRFDFTPQAGQQYHLLIDSPAGIPDTVLLPPVQTSGVVLHLTQGVVSDKIDIQLSSAGKDRQLLIGAYCRGRLLDHQSVAAKAGQQTALTLKPAADVTGVYRITVFEVTGDDGSTLQPVAERLLYRRSAAQLNLQLFTDKKSYTPGDRVTLSLKATDQHNKPAPAIVLVSVVDKSILKLRNDRTARALPTHFLLTSEVRGPEDLEYADVLLRDDSPQSETALDLLLGTQGWRRFIEQKLPAQVARALPATHDDNNRLLAVSGQGAQQQVHETVSGPNSSLVLKSLAREHEKLSHQLTAKQALYEAKSKATQQALDIQFGDFVSKRLEFQETKDQLIIYSRRLANEGPGYLMLVGALLGLLVLVTGIARLKSSQPILRRHLVGALCCFVLLLIGGTWSMSDSYYRTVLERLGGMPQYEPKQNPPGAINSNPGYVDNHGRQDWDKVDDAKANWQAAPKAMPKSPLPQVRTKNLFGLQEVKEPRLPVAIKPLPDLGVIIIKAQGGFANAGGGGLRDGGKSRGAGGFAGFPAFPGAPKGPWPNAVDGKKRAGAMQLRRQGIPGQAQAGENIFLADRLPLLIADAFIIRQYAHQHTASPDNIRRDFAETVYWHPALVLPGDKALDVSFDLSDAVTQFQVQVWGHTLDGRLAALTQDIASRLPFSLDAKLPIEISSTDKIAIPVALTNDTEKNRHVTLKVEADSLKLLDPAEQLLALNANSRLRKVLHMQPDTVQGEAKLRLLAQCDPFGSDSVERSFKIVPEGFPVADKHSGLLEKLDAYTVKLPARRDQWGAGTLKLQAQVFPSTLADLQKGLEALLREPGGCFEQTSSSNYPNVMILDYLKESGQIQPQLEKRASALLENGYSKLIAFECIDPKTKTKKEGYEWFGQTAPPHEALTAYGLLQFLDMAKYQRVDPAMIERTKKYLLGQRDGKGGFRRNPRALDSFGRAPDTVTDAYIVWALSEAGLNGEIAKELDAVVAKAKESKDPYTMALAGLGLLNCHDNAQAVDVLKTLKSKQKDDGSLTGKQTSITGSGGTQLSVETTSLALLAWLRANQPQAFSENVRMAANWIGKQRGAFGGYGSTQSTILALKALIAYTKDNKKTAEAGELRLYLNGSDQPAAVRAFPAGTLDPVIVEVADDKLLQPGDNKIRVEITGKNVFPYTLSWTYMALTPANKDACPVRLTTSTSAAKATEGDSLRVTAQLENVSGKEQAMAVAIIGVPGGCILPADMQELRKLVREGAIDAFEIRGRDLVFYWRGLAKDAKHVVNFSVICQIPGQYRGPASRAYLYYNTDERWWVEPLAVDINSK